MTAKQFKNLKPGDAVMLSRRRLNYYGNPPHIEAGTTGIFMSKAPAVRGRERDFAVVDFLGMPTSRVSAFLEDLT